MSKTISKSYGFQKEERSSFAYWFAHWCAYQMVALNCHCWKFHYLFHDWYKPWLRLIWDYKRVQMYHNLHSKHHLLHWFVTDCDCYKMDWEGMIIDWECSRFTKVASPLTAREEFKRIIKSLKELDVDNKTVRQLIELGEIPLDGTPEMKLYEYKVLKAEEELSKALEYIFKTI